MCGSRKRPDIRLRGCKRSRLCACANAEADRLEVDSSPRQRRKRPASDRRTTLQVMLSPTTLHVVPVPTAVMMGVGVDSGIGFIARFGCGERGLTRRSSATAGGSELSQHRQYVS